MTPKSSPNTVRTTATAAALAVLGFLLPLMLPSSLESFSKFMPPVDSMQAFGSSWILHVPVALLAAGIAAMVAWLCKGTRLAASLPAMVLVSAFLFSVWMGARPLLDARLDWQPSPWMVAGGLIATGMIAGFLRPSLEQNARPVAKALAFTGGGVALVALVMGLWPREKPAPQAADPSRPDILIITMDTLADAHLSSRGYARQTTPGLDALAATGVQFTHLVASSNYTTPTLNSLLTGQSALRHGASTLRSKPPRDLVDRSLPARLHAMGYSVRAVTTNPNGGIYKNGYGRWFDAVETDVVPLVFACSDSVSKWLPLSCAGVDLGIINPLVGRINVLLDWAGWWELGRHSDSRAGIAATDRLFRRSQDGRPVAVWLHLTPPHDPYVAPAPYLGSFDPSPRMRSFLTSTVPYHFAFADRPEDQALFRARYDESIASVTSEVATFVDGLQRDGRLDGAILLISADHGESFTPDYGGHGGPKLHDPLIRIPLIIRAPGLPSGVRVDMPVSQIDLAPTLLALAGGKPPADMEGRSLLPVIAGTAAPIPVYSFALERSGRKGKPQIGSAAMVDGRWKYVHHWNQPDLPGYRDLTDGLFDQSLDPGEQRNLIKQEAGRAAAMLASIRKKIEMEHQGAHAH